ncbi:MAG: hypothetical protein ACYCO9_17035 [Streptosporangiaceae bacterium]
MSAPAATFRPVTRPAVPGRARALAALAVADFSERTRRPGYLVTVAVAVVLGYLALPPASSHYVIMNAGGYRGVYNSAWAGTVTALAGALWLMGGGFYIVRTAIARDQQTRVGQILAATPLRNASYLAGKFVSNLMVLASMAGVLAVTALVMQLARGESRAIALGALLLPYALFTLPVLVLTAAAAVLVETVPVLRGGLGNIAWFFVWIAFAIAGGSVPLGFGAIRTSMRQAMAAQHLHPAEFSVGFTQIAHALRVFTWNGLAPPGGLVAGRLVLIAVCCVLAVVPAAWFGRFDPARSRPRARAASGGDMPAGSAQSAALQPSVPGAGQTAGPPAHAYRPLADRGSRPGPAAGRLLTGELRILIQGTPRWWWLVAAVLNVAGLLIPAGLAGPYGTSTALLLAAAWIWPVLIWSRLGAQRHENGLDGLLGACPGSYRQVAAEWLAGLTLTGAAGIGPLLRMAAASDGPRVAAWAAGALFIPSLALLLGSISQSRRLFQVLYLALWYAAVNQLAAADYMGTVLIHGRPAGPSAPLVAGAAVGMLAVTFGIRALRHATR